MPLDHLGERVSTGKYGLRLTRETYAIPNPRHSPGYTRESHPEHWATMHRSGIYADDEHRTYTPEFMERWRALALQNFDLNMSFFERIPHPVFDEAIAALLQQVPSLRLVTDLKTLDVREGVYVMVLDAYRQVYVGQAIDLRKRIRGHWSGNKPFGRLLLGVPEESILSIDSFRALDTTRVFAAVTARADALERRIVAQFPRDLILNRIVGGSMESSFQLGVALATHYRRDLIAGPTF